MVNRVANFFARPHLIKSYLSRVLCCGLASAYTIAALGVVHPAEFSGAKKKIFFIGTGGTIAGIAADPKVPSYDPGKVTINAILDALPDIKDEAEIDGEQLIDILQLEKLLATGVSRAAALKLPETYINGCSCDMNEYRWRLLAARTEQALNQEGYDAVIITHGTDTIEETAFFLEMTVRSHKPVILVGAARPSNDPQPDGPTNIRQAVSVALHPAANSRGVMLVMHNKVYPAFGVSEVRANLTTEPLVDRFANSPYGTLGYIWKKFVLWNDLNLLKTRNIRTLKFATDVHQQLPRVPIIWQYVDSGSGELINFYKNQGLHAFVIAGYGMGSASAEVRAELNSSRDPSSPFVYVVSSRTKDAVLNSATSYSQTDTLKGAVMSGPLNPYQNKVFLQLVLAGLARHDNQVTSITEPLGPNATLRDKIRAVYAEFLYRRLGFPIAPQP